MDNDFRKTEKMIYGYYRDLKYTEQLKGIISTLSSELTDRINNDGLGGIDYSKPAIQSGSVSSSTENVAISNMLHTTEELEKIEELNSDISKAKKEIDDKRFKNAKLRSIINQYTGEKKQLIELKYMEGKTLEQIGEITSWSPRTVRRKRIDIVEEIGRLLRLFPKSA